MLNILISCSNPQGIPCIPPRAGESESPDFVKSESDCTAVWRGEEWRCGRGQGQRRGTEGRGLHHVGRVGQLKGDDGASQTVAEFLLEMELTASNRGHFLPLHRRHPFEAERSDLVESMGEGRTGKRRSLEDALANTGKSDWEAFLNNICFSHSKTTVIDLVLASPEVQDMRA